MKDDDGAAMIRAALADPGEAREVWSYLIDTDGFRGHWGEGSSWDGHDDEEDLAACDRCSSMLDRLLCLYQ